MEYKHVEITNQIIKAFYTVYNNLGYGFLEKVYRNSMTIELRKVGLDVTPEARIAVCYEGEVVGEYFAGLLVAGAVLVELKAVQQLAKEHEAQLLNYLKATPCEVGLLLNFGPRAEVRRKAFDNARKGAMRWLPGTPV